MFDFLDWPQFITYITAVTFLNLLPGMNVLFICGQSIQRGKRHGIWAALGVSTGVIIYITATIFGIAELFQLSPMLFRVIRFAGIFYLFFLSYKAFSNTAPSLDLNAISTPSDLWGTYGKGILTTLLNPKELMFFCTFLPQFTNETSQVPISMQLFYLGAWDIFSGTLVSIGYVFLVVKIRENVIQNAFVQNKLQHVTGIIFAALALGLLWADLTT